MKQYLTGYSLALALGLLFSPVAYSQDTTAMGDTNSVENTSTGENQEGTSSEEVATTAETSQDVANTINPQAESPEELKAAGIMRIDKVSQDTAELYRSGELVERISLSPEEEGGCTSGEGSTSKVSFCTETEALLTISGGPQLHCSHYSSLFYGPCALKLEQ